MTEQSSSGQRPPLPSEPPAPPSAKEAMAEREWQELTEQSLRDVANSAGAWKEGLLGLVTMFTSGFLLLNGVGVDTVVAPWSALVVGFWFFASAAAVAGLWLGLSATAGVPATLTYGEFVKDYGSVAAFRRSQSRRVAVKLAWSRAAVATALTATLLGATVLQIGPLAEPPKLVVTTPVGAVCGEVASADGGEIRLLVAGQWEPTVIPMTAVTGMTVTDRC